MYNNLSKLSRSFYRLSFVFLLFLSSARSHAQANPASNEEPTEIAVSAPRSANQEPAGAITTLISAFRYDPQVVIQSRNIAEAQSDITIRGGTFDMSGINIGAATIYDPESGHYTADMPIPPAFLSSASVLTGADNALAGFNAAVGSIYSGFSPAENWNTTKIGIGEFGTNIAEVNTDSEKILEGDLGSLAIASNVSYSSSNGSNNNNDNELSRYATRIQLSNSDLNQTDLVYSHQSKNYGWPISLAPQSLPVLATSNTFESNSANTSMVLLNHRTKISSTGNIELTSYYKRNNNNYHLTNLIEDKGTSLRHTSKVFGGGAQGLEYIGKTYVGINGQVYGDRIESNDLDLGNYHSRTLAKLSSYLGRKVTLDHHLILEPTIGAAWDKSDETTEHISPISKISLVNRRESSEHSLYAEYSVASQLPGYEAHTANPNSVFLESEKFPKRETSKNTELGYKYVQEKLLINTALFYRNDSEVTAWEYSNFNEPFTIREATNLNIATRGAEIYSALSEGNTVYTSSYSLLDKHNNDDIEDSNAGLYAFNYPAHRVTASIITKPKEEIELRGDIEFSKNYINQLRTSYVISSISANYEIAEIIGLNLGVIVDNIGNEHFEEIPGVTGAGRLASFVVNYVW